MRGTVVIHTVTASNDILDDHNWDGIYMSVAVDWGDPECPEVIDGDISESLLERRLHRDGWRVVSEDDAFVHDGTRWVRHGEGEVDA